MRRAQLAIIAILAAGCAETTQPQPAAPAAAPQPAAPKSPAVQTVALYLPGMNSDLKIL